MNRFTALRFVTTVFLFPTATLSFAPQTIGRSTSTTLSPSFFSVSQTTTRLKDASSTNSEIPIEWQGVVLSKLKQIQDPDLNVDIVTAGFCQNLQYDPTNSKLSMDLELTTPACPIKDQFQRDCEQLLLELPWIQQVEVTLTAQAQGTSSTSLAGLAQVGAIVAVSSCKGGVGKSTTAVNLAFSLQQLGATVGILDTDLYGPSLPTMVTPDDDIVRFVGRQIAPLQRNGVRLLSFGHIHDQAAVMRGAMVTQLLEQFLDVCQWGKLDYLIVDMPPGTGDIPLTLTQKLNLTAAVIVTTPTELSFQDVKKGIEMFDTVQVPCIAVVENMAHYELPESMKETLAKAVQQSSHVSNAEQVTQEVWKALQNTPLPIFGAGHRSTLQQLYGIEQHFKVPLMDQVAYEGDHGTPFVLQQPDSSATRVYRSLAQAVVQEVAKVKYTHPNQRLSLEYNRDAHVVALKQGSSPQEEEICTLSPATIRRACRCAACVEELTGRQILLPSMVSENIAPLRMQSVGNYAWSIDWSDGHRSLYPEKSLRALASQKQKSSTKDSSPASPASVVRERVQERV